MLGAQQAQLEDRHHDDRHGHQDNQNRRPEYVVEAPPGRRVGELVGEWRWAARPAGFDRRSVCGMAVRTDAGRDQVGRRETEWQDQDRREDRQRPLPYRRLARSTAPMVFAIVAVLVQLAGLILERDDPTAFGDNIGGILYFGATVVLLAFQYRATPRFAGHHEASRDR